MHSETGRFEPVPKEQEGKPVVRIADKFFPTLAVGERVEIKGIGFVVTRIKADGKLGLKMLAEPKIATAAAS